MSGTLMGVVLGHYTSLSLIDRLLLSVPQVCYRFAQEAQTSWQPVPESVRQDAQGAVVFAGHDTTPLSLRPGEALTLHIYVDGFLVEVVANNRASLATSVPWPLNGDAVLPLGDMEVAAFDAWALKSIWA